MQVYARLVTQGKSTLRECRDMLRAHRERVQQRADDLRGALELVDRKLALYDAWIARAPR